MRKAHLKTNQIRIHMQNADGSHTPGTWALCNACSRVYKAVTPRMQQAEDYHRRNPGNLTRATTQDGRTFYIPLDLPPHVDRLPVYKQNGAPYLQQANREAPYLPVYMNRDELIIGE